jgi:hypothetical protein
LAYFTLMASVGEAEVDALRKDSSLVLHPSLVSGASHLLSYLVKVQPLGQLLNEAVDGGELLHIELWYRHAAAARESVVSALDLPGDEQRAQRVRIPWKPK